MQIAVLVCKNILQRFIEYGVERTVINNLSIDFKKGERIALTGASGVGKSTLLYLLAGLDQPTAGSIFISSAGEKTASSCHSYRQQKVGIVLQSPYLIQQLTAQENIMMRALITGMPFDVAYQKAAEFLAAVGLAAHANEYPATLSGGQQQRVAIARALITEPDFLLADEPTSSLDHATAAQVMDLIFEQHKKNKMGLIIATHDDHIIREMDTVFELKNGIVHQRFIAKRYEDYGQTGNAQKNV